jgi:hypothetical protein
MFGFSGKQILGIALIALAVSIVKPKIPVINTL